MITIIQKKPTNVVARSSYPPPADMNDVAISPLLSLSQPYRKKRRDCHAPICAGDASLRSQRHLKYIDFVIAGSSDPTPHNSAIFIVVSGPDPDEGGIVT